MLIDLKGRKVLITGGSRGIGRAAAVMFAGAGCDVAVNYLDNQAAAEETAQMIRDRGRECLLVKAQISKKNEAEAMAREIADSWGTLDVLVNNAGVWTYLETGALDEQVYRETIGINLDGVFYVTNAVLPLIKKTGGGVVIMVGSTAGVRGEAFHSHYAATKGGLHALTKSLAIELAPFGIRVNCVAPGWVETEMCREVFSDAAFKEEVRQSIPLKRIPLPDDIAAPIVFLASDLARHITGEILNINGGSVLCGG